MSEFIHKNPNASVLMYRIVYPTKYRRAVFPIVVDDKIQAVCREIQKRYEITFLEMDTDDDHVHFFVPSVPMYSPKQLVQTIKSLTVREIFKSCPEIKQYLWGGKFWSECYFVSTVGAHANEQTIKKYVKLQGKIESNGQLKLY